MNIEPFPGLDLNFRSLLLFAAVIVAAEIALGFRRKVSWALACWLPIVAVTGVAVLGFFSRSVPVSGDGYAGLSAFITAIFFSPWLVMFVGALLAKPHFAEQSGAAWLVGAFVSGLLLVALFLRGEAKEKTAFQLVDADGKPVAEQVLLEEAAYWGNPVPVGSIVTAGDGTFSLWLTPGRSLFLRVPTEGDYIGKFEFWNQQKVLGDVSSDFETTDDWENPGEAGRGSYPLSFIRAQRQPVQLILKTRKSLTSPYIASQLRSVLVTTRDTGQSPVDLSKAVANPEALQQLDLIAEVMAKQPGARPALIEGLNWSGRFITEADNATNSFYHGNDWDSFRPLLGPYFGLTADQLLPVSGKSNSPFRDSTRALVSRLIETVRPYFGTERSASLVVQNLGTLGRPAIANFAEAFPTATKECQESMLRCLSALRPSVDEVAWLVESNDPHLVLAGYDATVYTIKPEERPLAKERVDAALARASSPQDIHRGKILSANMGRIP